MTTATTDQDELLRARVRRLGLYGLLANWHDVVATPWLHSLLDIEETERQRRSLERRQRTARLTRFKPMADFDWTWPQRIDRDLVDELFTLRFVDEVTNVVLVGPSGVGKSMIASNLAYQALLRGHTVRVTTAAAMLGELAVQDGATALQRRLRHYARPAVLIVDEVGYLSYDNRHADLLFELVNLRYEKRPIILTTNKPFAEWGEVFPNASSVVALVDRLLHSAEILQIDADSYRLKEAKEKAALRTVTRPKRGPKS